jgi:hypothetical protein
MEVGETVVLVGDVNGMPAGKEGRVMRIRDDMLLIGFRSADCLEFRVSQVFVLMISAREHDNRGGAKEAS